MNLSELLALFPDNDTGEVSAADVRAMVTEFYNDIAAVQADVDAIDVAALAAAVASLQSTVSGHTTTLATLQGQVNGLATGQTSLANALNALTGRVDAHDTSIASIVAVNDIQATQIAGITAALPAIEGTLAVTGLGGSGSGGSGTEDVCRPTVGTGMPTGLLDGNPHNIRFAMFTGEPSANLTNALKRVRFDRGTDPTAWVQGDNGIAISGVNMKNWVDSLTPRQVQYNAAGRYLRVIGFNDSVVAPE